MVLGYDVNVVAVIVAAIVGFIVSFIWWGPLFGMKWARYNGFSEKDMKKAKEKGGMGGKMFIAFIAQILAAYVLSIFLTATGSVSINAALMVAFWAWLGFVATVGVGIVLWNDKPWGLFWLNNIGWLVTLLVMSVVLSIWA